MERIAHNESTFREVNELMPQWPGITTAEKPQFDYVCECGELDCHERVRLTAEAYEAVRTDSRRFIIVPGHEKPDAETVIERHADYAVILKAEDVGPIVDRRDPRSP
jgi:hypothetical protein